ncbi:MAG: tetratricopeptide repeat protein, partial [Acidovorax sp.]|uniref:tetratricopeptide repeat protein n=1 Tax=Acidovorax sp. TaxID=1872122 RepID=UPI00391948EE
SVWGHLALLCLKCAPLRPAEAEQALAQALKLELGDATLLQELGELLAEAGQFRSAEGPFRRALVATPAARGGDRSSGARLLRLLGRVVSAQGRAEERRT